MASLPNTTSYSPQPKLDTSSAITQILSLHEPPTLTSPTVQTLYTLKAPPLQKSYPHKTPSSALENKPNFFDRLRLKSDVSERPFKQHRHDKTQAPLPDPKNATPPTFTPSTPLLSTPYNFSLGVAVGPILHTTALDGLTALASTYHHPQNPPLIPPPSSFSPINTTLSAKPTSTSLSPAKDTITHSLRSIDTTTQIRQACDNVAFVLNRLRPGAGWQFVYKVRTWHTNLSDSLDIMAAFLIAR